MRSYLFIAAVLLLLVNACKQPVAKITDNTPVRKILDPKNMDTTIHPGDDFYKYANGKWMKNNPIPKEESEWGSFNEVQENNFKALHLHLHNPV